MISVGWAEPLVRSLLQFEFRNKFLRIKIDEHKKKARKKKKICFNWLKFLLNENVEWSNEARRNVAGADSRCLVFFNETLNIFSRHFSTDRSVANIMRTAVNDVYAKTPPPRLHAEENSP